MTAHSSPFDSIAAGYDAVFTHTQLGRWLRARVQQQLCALFPPGSRVLELGCGTGQDAVWLAQRGVCVVATDAAPEMLETARRQVAAAGVADRVKLELFDLNDPLAWVPGRAFDGLLSNFGALNCLPDRRAVAEAAAGWVRPGGHAAMVVMGPFCPWELAWHLGHGQVRRGLRRFRAGASAHVGAGATVPTWYPSPRRLRSEFAPWFRPVAAMGIGVLLPPTYLRHLVDRQPALFARLATWESRWSGHFPCTWLNDHYLLVLERREQAPCTS